MLTFRRIDTTELSTLCAIAERTFREAWQDSNPPEPFNLYCQTAFAPDTLRKELEHAGAEFYLACVEDGIPAAYLKLNFDRQPPELDGATNVQLERIYVLRAFQSRGLGVQMLAFVTSRTRAAGAEWLWLSVWQEAPRAIAFYEKHGFTTFGTEIFWLGEDPQSDWLMKRRITG